MQQGWEREIVLVLLSMESNAGSEQSELQRLVLNWLQRQAALSVKVAESRRHHTHLQVRGQNWLERRETDKILCSGDKMYVSE